MNILATHGTHIFTLTPSSVVTAAERDLKLWAHKREIRSKGREQAQPYAFHRDHVRRAGCASELIRLGLLEGEKGWSSSKSNTRAIYGDPHLLKAALALLRREAA